MEQGYATGYALRVVGRGVAFFMGCSFMIIQVLISASLIFRTFFASALAERLETSGMLTAPADRCCVKLIVSGRAVGRGRRTMGTSM